MGNKENNLLFVYYESNENAKNIAMKNVEKLLKENNKRTVVLHDEDLEKIDGFIYQKIEEDSIEEQIKALLRMSPERVFIICKEKHLCKWILNPFLLNYDTCVVATSYAQKEIHSITNGEKTLIQRQFNEPFIMKLNHIFLITSHLIDFRNVLITQKDTNCESAVWKEFNKDNPIIL